MTYKDLIIAIKLPFCKERQLYRSFYSILGFYPKHIDLYKQALIHKSFYAKDKDGRPLHNERLEFLGDAILDAVVGDIVYHHFKGKQEGFLTTTRSNIVKRETLGHIAEEMGLSKLIKSHCYSQSHNSYLGGNAFEAIVGAIYLDQGYGRCMKFVKERMLKHFIDLDKMAYKEVNFKSKLLEWGQKNRFDIVYDLISEGKDEKGDSFFLTQVLVEGICCGKGSGFSKKESQQKASKTAYLTIKGDKALAAQIAEVHSRNCVEAAQEPENSGINTDVVVEPVTDTDSTPVSSMEC